MEGKLIQTDKGWYLSNENIVLPIKQNDSIVVGVNHFVFDGIQYNVGDTIGFRIENVYIEPPPDIHSNRGEEIQMAIITETWDHILTGITGGLKKLSDGSYRQLKLYLKENFEPPIRKRRV